MDTSEPWAWPSPRRACPQEDSAHEGRYGSNSGPAQGEKKPEATADERSISHEAATTSGTAASRSQDKDDQASLFSTRVEMPKCTFSFHQKSLKGQDKALVASPIRLPGTTRLRFHLFGVFDGHNGQSTAQFCKENILKELMPRLPRTELPAERDSPKEFEIYLRHLRDALVDSFLALDRKATETKLDSGCTATVVLVTGWLVTIANVGDSSAMIQTEDGMQILTQSDRLEDSLEEQSRLIEAGAVVARLNDSLNGPATGDQAGLGPLRVWPGAVCMSRAIGDADCHPAVVAYPHIKQVRLPTTGARILVASDGVWDSRLGDAGVSRILQTSRLQGAAFRVVQEVLKCTGLRDDTTALVVDTVPHSMNDYIQEADCVTSLALQLQMLFRKPKVLAIHTFGIVNASETVPKNPVERQRISDERGRGYQRLFSVSSEQADGTGPQLPRLEHLPSFGGLSVFRSAPSNTEPPALRRCSTDNREPARNRVIPFPPVYEECSV